jgi:hypothetical protein
MRRMIVPIAFFAVVGIGIFLYLFKKEAVLELYDANIGGYPKAKSAQQCVDLFKKAIKAREYKTAAKYCSKEYAEQLTRAHDAARELGKAIDDLTFRMEKDGVSSSEIDVLLFLHDPFSPDLSLTIQTSGDTSATASVDVSKPSLKTQRPGTWTVDPLFLQALYFGQPAGWVIQSEDKVWKINLGVMPAQRERIDRLISHSKNYSNAFKKMSEELRVERTTKNDVEKRLRDLLTEAVNAKP